MKPIIIDDDEVERLLAEAGMSSTPESRMAARFVGSYVITLTTKKLVETLVEKLFDKDGNFHPEWLTR